MGSMVILVGLVVVVLAGTCWYAGERGVAAVAHPAKVATLLGLIVLAILLGARQAPGGPALLVGLVLSLLGDAALTRPGPTAFATGLGAFLLAHLAYVAAFAPHWFHPVGLLVVAVLVAPFAALSFPRARRGAVAAEGPRLGQAMTAYAATIAAMALAAGATGQVLVVIGAVLFVISDVVLALDRFDAPRARAHLVVLSLYHVAQVAIVLGVLR